MIDLAKRDGDYLWNMSIQEWKTLEFDAAMHYEPIANELVTQAGEREERAVAKELPVAKREYAYALSMLDCLAAIKYFRYLPLDTLAKLEKEKVGLGLSI